MESDSFFAHRNVGGGFIGPRAGVVILDAVTKTLGGEVGVAAEHAVRLFETGVQNGAGRDFVRQAKPARVEAIGQPRNIFAAKIQFLKMQVQQRAYAAEGQIPGNEAIELVAVNRQVPLAGELPGIFLIDPYADQVRHDRAQAAVVIALDPNHLDIAFRVGELADEAEKFPMVFGKTREIEVGKNIAQQNQAAEGMLREHGPRIVSAAELRSQMKIGKDERVVGDRTHQLFFSKRLLTPDENCTTRRAVYPEQ